MATIKTHTIRRSGTRINDAGKKVRYSYRKTTRTRSAASTPAAQSVGAAAAPATPAAPTKYKTVTVTKIKRLKRNGRVVKTHRLTTRKRVPVA